MTQGIACDCAERLAAMTSHEKGDAYGEVVVGCPRCGAEYVHRYPIRYPLLLRWHLRLLAWLRPGVSP